MIVTLLPAVAPLVKIIAPTPVVAKFCVIPELFVMLPPLMVNVKKGVPSPPTLIVNALAPELNVMESMVTSAERDRKRILEVLNVAVSPAMTGGIPVFQFPPLFQLPSLAIVSQMESTANAGAARAKNSRRAPRAVAKNP